MDEYLTSSISNPVKLVIWDLDETFWKGTLSEEGIEPVAHNIEIVRNLVDCGIMCSICSKNSFEDAKAKLHELGIWEMFVFPHIDWTPKGQAINTMLERMGLRAENTLFLDDNHMNLEEATFFNDGIMCFDAKQDFSDLLAHPHLKGKNDAEHSRLKQYKLMEGKFDEMKSSGLSNENFLRQSEIKIRIITDIDDKMDRVLELLNRTNQLNFTKVRANTDKEREDLGNILKTSGMHAGLIHVKDRYGDYGIVGFFCVRTKFSGTTVHHFAFSCRTLNMGVEQWVWQYLNKPEFKTIGPVSGNLDPEAQVDWITEVSTFDATDDAEQKRLVLVGGCDLLQVSFYCGTNRDEFVNKPDDLGLLVRYDDVGFFINPRDMELKHSKALKNFMGWTYEDMKQLDRSLGEADLILLSLYFSVPSDNLFTFGGKEFGGKYWGTVPPRRLKQLMKDPETALRFAKEMHHRRLPIEDRLDLTYRAFQFAYSKKTDGVPMFILSAASEHGEQAKRTRPIRLAFNDMCKKFCSLNPEAVFVDVDRLLNPDEFADSDHYTRTGYFKIAEFVNRQTDEVRGSMGAADCTPALGVQNPNDLPESGQQEVKKKTTSQMRAAR
jgi:FkbH-like protein